MDMKESSLNFREVVRNPELSLKAKGLLALLLNLPSKQVTVESLQKETKEGRDAIQNAAKELLQFGYLKRTFVRKDGKIAGRNWEVAAPNFHS